MAETYKIMDVIDFLKVPEDRLSDCLEVFKIFLETMRGLMALAGLDAEAMGKTPEEVLKLMAYTWVDDGKNDCTINISVEETVVQPKGSE